MIICRHGIQGQVFVVVFVLPQNFQKMFPSDYCILFAVASFTHKACHFTYMFARFSKFFYYPRRMLIASSNVFFSNYLEKIYKIQFLPALWIWLWFSPNLLLRSFRPLSHIHFRYNRGPHDKIPKISPFYYMSVSGLAYPAHKFGWFVHLGTVFWKRFG